VAKPKVCPECGLAANGRGLLHPDCKFVRRQRAKAERERSLSVEVQSVVPAILDRSTITVPLKWLQQQVVCELQRSSSALLAAKAKRQTSLIRRLVKTTVDTMVSEGAVHLSGRRYFLPKMLRERSSAVQ
jgi:hypothetical protein